MEDQLKQSPAQDNEVSAPLKTSLPSYIGTKVVQAKPMSHETFARANNKWQEGQETMGDGYLVIYEDGYRSWSPKAIFERCYRLISPEEKRLIQ